MRFVKRLAAVTMLAVAAWLPASPSFATNIQEVTSPGGIKAWLVQEPSIPMISVEIAWRGGSRLDPAGKEGLANLVSGLLDEGAGDLDSRAFQTRLEDLAITLSFDSGKDNFYGKLKTLTKNRDEAFRLLSLAVSAPRFDAEPVERIRRQIIAGLISDSEDPDSIASKVWFKRAFPDHPYGKPNDGTIDSVKAVGVDDLKGFVAGRLARDNMIIGVVGDISPDELGHLLDKTFATLPAKAAPYAIDDSWPPAHGAVIVVDKDIPQSVVVFGQRGIKRSDPDWTAAYVMNYVLGGGGFTSRLMEEVREKNGLAYSVYSYLYPFEHSGVHLGGVGTQNAKVAESLRLVRQELRRIHDDGITAEELANAKTYLNGSFPLRLSSNASIARLLVTIQVDDLGIDYLDRRAGLIDAVTLDDVKRVAKRLLKPDDLIVVIVGKPAGVDGEHISVDG